MPQWPRVEAVIVAMSMRTSTPLASRQDNREYARSVLVAAKEF
ncbi:hypothetical protein [Kibdelosporangium philippinense]